MKTPLSLPRPTFLPRKSSLIVISVRGGTFARRSRSSSSHLSTSLFRVSLHVLDLYAREPLMPGRIERLNLASRIRAPITVIIACFTNYSSFISPSVFVFRFEVRETPTIRASLSFSLYRIRIEKKKEKVIFILEIAFRENGQRCCVSGVKFPRELFPRSKRESTRAMGWLHTRKNGARVGLIAD